jgi:hypothetical protein
VNKDLPYEQIASFLTHFKRPLDETLAKDKSKKDQASNFINIVLLREFAGSSAQAEASETKVEP